LNFFTINGFLITQNPSELKNAVRNGIISRYEKYSNIKAVIIHEFGPYHLVFGYKTRSLRIEKRNTESLKLKTAACRLSSDLDKDEGVFDIVRVEDRQFTVRWIRKIGH
jgi:hypothetical protein